MLTHGPPQRRWQQQYVAAKTAIQDRDAKVAEVAELIERDLVLLGCTAIEDKLQEGVPQAIERLALAGIKIWVLTGDKQVRGFQDMSSRLRVSGWPQAQAASRMVGAAAMHVWGGGMRQMRLWALRTAPYAAQHPSRQSMRAIYSVAHCAAVALTSSWAASADCMNPEWRQKPFLDQKWPQHCLCGQPAAGG